MTNLTTQQRYDVPGGTLRVVLQTDHALSGVEREDLDRIGAACEEFAAHERAAHPHPDPPPGADPAAEVDEAIWELGGDAGISAG
jgi:hypothetical protein